ncbi:MAG: [Oscillospiraceae bacterium]|nr:[FeFe] hydrogenase H-cluster radical SAM maturase HydE [Oscillospiraceae bacterium]
MGRRFFELCDKLENKRSLDESEYAELISEYSEENAEYIFSKARCAREQTYSNLVFLRGLIEISSYCRNDCNYCGLRKSNKNAQRYRLSKQQIMECCEQGYALGLRTFVLQGGEDAYFTDEIICEIVSQIKSEYSDCAITLSLGERKYESYKAMFEAGAQRYLLRHETADKHHYQKLHPEIMTLENRISCLENLKQIGFQTGCGFMVGSPFQTTQNLACDLKFIEKFKPHMVGLGPFIPHKDTPFAGFEKGSAELTLLMLSIVRLIRPNVLLPATTALSTIDQSGHIAGLNAGANVIMPNLSPIDVRKKYSIYDGKKHTDVQAAENISRLKSELENAGYRFEITRGDFIGA